MMIENVKTYATLKNLYVLYLYTIVFDGTVDLYLMAVKGLLVMTAKIMLFSKQKRLIKYFYIGKENNIAACNLQISSVGIKVRYVFM